jgi:hypothetical protein
VKHEQALHAYEVALYELDASSSYHMTTFPLLERHVVSTLHADVMSHDNVTWTEPTPPACGELRLLMQKLNVFVIRALTFKT